MLLLEEASIERMSREIESALERRRNAIADLKATSNLQRGQFLHQAAILSGDASNVFVANALISMYVRCGSLETAHRVFDSLKYPDVVCWNALMFGYLANGEGEIALGLLSRMKREGCEPVDRTYVAALKACSDIAGKEEAVTGESRERGKELHLLALRSGYDTDIYVQSSLVDLYARCGSTDLARDVFDRMEHRNVVSWTALILGYAINGEAEVALLLFRRMAREDCEPNTRTFVAALKACTDLSEEKHGMERGKAVHLLASASNNSDLDIYVQSTLVAMYSTFGSMEEACGVFNAMKHRNVVSWNALILGYADNGKSETALDLFARLECEGCTPDARSFLAALKACTDIASKEGTAKVTSIQTGKALHLLTSQTGWDADIYVQSTLVDVYAKCGAMRNAREVFNSMKYANVVAWNALVMGYADNGEGLICLHLFNQMEQEGCEPDGRTFVAALKACTELALKEDVKGHFYNAGRRLHLLVSGNGLDLNIYVQSTLVDMYAKCGSMGTAHRVFNSVKHPDVVCWTALTFGYAEIGEFETALELFLRMHHAGCGPDAKVFVVALKACTGLAVKHKESSATSERGIELHLLALRGGYDLDIHVQASLVEMYTKYGLMDRAWKVFDRMEQRNAITWTALILGYVENGEGEIALDVFSQMGREGCSPDAFTYSAVLKACGILGAVELGKAFHAEIDRCDFKDNAGLQTCLLDFYVKCGCLFEAKQVFTTHTSRDLKSWNKVMAGYSFHGDTAGVFELFDRMQDADVEPDATTFKCILTACSHGGLVEKGVDYFKAMAFKYGIEPGADHYVCLIDLFCRSKRLDDAIAALRDMPLTPNCIAWMAVLGACWKLKSLEVGKLAFDSVVSLENGNAAAYVLMSNIYESRKVVLQKQECGEGV